MPYQSDYVMRLIEQLSGLVRRAAEKLGVVDSEEPDDIAGQAIGLALGMDPALASRLSPKSLASLLRLNDLDKEVIGLVAQAIELEVETLRARGLTAVAEVRRDQAIAVRSLLESKATKPSPE
jgi:hypothetical protein